MSILFLIERDTYCTACEAQLPRNELPPYLNSSNNKLHWNNFQKAGQKFLSTREIAITFDIFQFTLINSIVTKKKKKQIYWLQKFTQ